MSSATVTVKGANKPTQSDENGNFSINPNVGSVLRIFFIGMAEKEIVVTSSTNPVSVDLDLLLNSMNEVVRRYLMGFDE